MRIFIAINLSDEIKNELYQVVNKIKEQAISGTFTEKENFHLTLAFLGEISDKQLLLIKEVMKGVMQESFLLSLSGIGKFYTRDGSIYWCSIKKSEQLLNLQKLLIHELHENGFIPDDKDFKPHITLVRRCKLIDKAYESHLNQTIPNMDMLVSKISIMKSERVMGKLIYTEIFTKNL